MSAFQGDAVDSATVDPQCVQSGKRRETAHSETANAKGERRGEGGGGGGTHLGRRGSQEDLERSYFKDMNDLRADPRGKLFEAQSFVGAERQDRLVLLDKVLERQDGSKKEFSAEEVRKNRRTIFIVYQMGIYASPYANEWKDRILKRWPDMWNRIYSVEIRERNMAYSLLRWVTGSSVRKAWQSSRNEAVESAEERQSRMLHWQETRKTHVEARALRKNLEVGMNKYLPFVYVVQHQGLVLYKAVGKPKKSEFELLESVMKS